MLRHQPDLNSHAIPVPDAIFSKVCRATPSEAREVAASLPEVDRVRLALFCNGRTHLRERGRAIASGCSLASLVMEGGQAGYILHGQVSAGPETWGMPRIGGNKITLAHG